ncbi:MAG: ScpA family protein [Chloroflexota bacterium]
MTVVRSVLAGRHDLASLPVARPAPASVRISPEVHPDRAAHVVMADFDGPLALLLALIEQRQLDILTVPLGDLATAFLEALTEVSADQLPHISAFITVASQLILIKSRALLPRAPKLGPAGADDGPDPEEALRLRLLEYKRFRDAGAVLAARLDAGMALFHREPATAAAAAQAGARPAPGPPLDPRLLARAIERSLQVVPPPPRPAEVVRRVVTIEERADIIRRALRRAPTVVLQDLLRGSRDRVIIAITFLAMLEMTKTREVVIEQAEPFGPITCRRWEAVPMTPLEEDA